ncbi:MAG: hypothetical protein HUU22_05975 [Phycisphaerae bacterium]|nr:hypothetical protein [Phycisphaerae bacterium]NUQ45561.1 hypothetical protein [Phycisphaerae bacterium]
MNAHNDQSRALPVRRWRDGLLVLLASSSFVLAWDAWARRSSLLPDAAAQIPNAGAQRVEQIDEVRRTNELLRRILERLEQGPVPVRVVEQRPAEKKGEAKP